MERIVILGGGESGWGTAMLAKKEGFEVFLSDSGTLAAKYRESLISEGIRFEEGGHHGIYHIRATEVIKSPGIPDTAEVVQHFYRQQVPVVSEIEFAGRYSRGKTICITGSNGKTTTATLTYEILRAAGLDVALSGNIGESYAARVARGDRKWYVLELSSFQLDGMYTFRPDIAVLLNITPDHLDRYDYNIENYAASKMRICANLLPEDTFIYNTGDTTIIRRRELAALKAGRMPFTTSPDGSPQNAEKDKVRVPGAPIIGGASLQNGMLNIIMWLKSIELPVSELGIKGMHNAANAMAASLAALRAGVEPAVIKNVLRGFRGVEHRMEDAGTVGGVRFVNDSKATNTDAAWYALKGTPGPVVWIAGGTDKGNDYTELKKIVAGKVKSLVCMGKDNKKLMEEFGGIVSDIREAGSLDEAMSAAVTVAERGDTVLLSPACASFDLFRNYEHRGRLFKEWVDNYKEAAKE